MAAQKQRYPIAGFSRIANGKALLNGNTFPQLRLPPVLISVNTNG
jgi:hypothetical protein